MKPFRRFRSKMKVAAGALVAAFMSCNTATANEWRFSGAIGGELRSFVQSGSHPGQLDAFQPSLQIESEVSWEKGDFDFYFEPFLRLDSRDSARTHFDAREAYIRWRSGQITVRAGMVKTFWGVAESRHLVDIINQWDFLEDIDREDKLGQPLAELSYSPSWGELSGLVMPAFRQRKFPGASGRFRFPLRIDEDRAQFGDCGDSHCGVDFAFRYSHYVGDWDIGVSFFNGFDRDPRLVPDLSLGVVIPHYDEVTQVALDIQRTRGAWLWKFEGFFRDTPFESYFASVAGLEYTFYGLAKGNADLGVIVEYEYDGRSVNQTIAPPVFENNDVFAGFRLALNDTADTTTIVGFVTDLDDGSTFGSFEASRRFDESWTLDLEGRMILIAKSGNPLHQFRRDSNVTIRIKRYF